MDIMREGRIVITKDRSCLPPSGFIKHGNVWLKNTDPTNKDSDLANRNQGLTPFFHIFSLPLLSPVHMHTRFKGHLQDEYTHISHVRST